MHSPSTSAGDGSAFSDGLDRLRLGGETLAVQRFDEVFDLLAVGTVIKGDAAIAVDGEVVHLVGEAGCAQVLGRGAGDLADSGHQPLAAFTGAVVIQFHVPSLQPIKNNTASAKPAR